MSLLRRKRRQNRIELRTIPAIREARPSLETPSVRDWRNIFGRKLAEQRKRNRSELLESLDNMETLRFDINRDVRQVQRIYEQNRIRARISRETRKPLNVIQLNGQIRVDLPPEHPLCISRQTRREVMFATGKSGRGGQRPRKQENIILRCLK